MEIDYSHLSVLNNYLLIGLQHKHYKVYLSGKDCSLSINIVGYLNQMVDEKNIIRRWASLVLTFSGHPTFD